MKKTVSIVKRIRREINLRRLGIYPNTTIKHQWYGNHYGGMNVAVDMVPPNAIVYSFGVGTDISFDLAMMERHDCHIFAFDPTPKSIDWIAEQELSENFTFLPFGIAATSSKATFYLPTNEDHVSGSLIAAGHVNTSRSVEVDLLSIKAICQRLEHTRIDILKMDIEGAEYDVIPTLIEADVEIGQLFIEFHHRIKPFSVQRTREAVDQLKRAGYRVFAVSDSMEEVSFIHQDYRHQ